MYSWIYPKDFNMGILTPNSAVSSLFLLSPFSPWRVEIGIGLWELGEEQAPKNVHRPQVQVQTDNLHIPETFNQVNKTCLNTLLLNHKYWFIYNNPRQLYLQEHHPKLQVKYISGLAWAYIFEVWFLTTSSRYTSSEQHTGLSFEHGYSTDIHFQAWRLSATLDMVLSPKSPGTVLSSGRSWLTCDLWHFKQW